MKTRLNSGLLLSALALVMTFAMASFAQMVGGYKAIATDDENAISAAEFAVDAQSEKANKEYQLGEIVKAERQVVQGSNYRLCMEISEGGEESFFVQAVVYVNLQNESKLTSWVNSNCGGGGGATTGKTPEGYKPTDKNNAGVGLAADFAVKTQSNNTKTPITLTEILKAEDREPKLGARDFRLCLSVTADGKPLVAQALVSMDQYSNLKMTLWEKSMCGNSRADGGNGSITEGFKPDTGYKAVEIDDAGADLAAQNAIIQQAKKTKAKITFGEMIKVEDKEPRLGARDFRLCMSVVNNGKPGRAEALISVDQYSNYKLTSWADKKCGESADGFTTVSNDDAGIGLAADFAVKQHSKDTKIPHKLASIIKGENKGMFAMTYRVCMNVSEDGETRVIQAVVSMDQYSNMKLVSWTHSNCGK